MKRSTVAALVAMTIQWCGWGSLCPAETSTTQPSQQELLEQLHQLKDQVNRLQARLDAQQHQPPTTQPAGLSHVAGQRDLADERQTIADLMQDANRRFSLDDMESFTAGYIRDQGVIIRSEDGDFMLHPWAFLQVRNATNYRDRAPVGTTTASSTDTENGFELPRAKFILDGNVFSRDFTYQFIWATSDTTGNLQLQDAWGRYHLPNTPFAIRAGQIRNPLDHEQILFATKTLTPERSIVNNVLLNGDDIVKGASIGYGFDTPSTWRVEAAITSGQRNFDTDFQPYPTNTANWGAAARLDWKFMGDWKDYNQFTSLGDKDPLLIAGAGVDYTEAGAAAALTHVVDAQFNLPQGLSLYGAYLGRYTRHNAGAPTTNGQPSSATATAANTYDSTFRFMAADLIDQHWEPFFRYEYLHFDGSELPVGTSSNVNDFTLGANYYFQGHRAKISAAASYLPEGSPVSNTLGDLLVSHKGNEIIVQVQFQLIL